MTLVNHDTGEVIEEMSAAEAEHVTESIKWRLDQIATTHAEVMPMIREALARRAWDALGYRSPGEYAADRFGGALHRLSVPVRQAVVQELTEAGMSTRAIAPVVGVGVSTVKRDAQVAHVGHLPSAPAGEGNSASGADDPAPAEATSGVNRPEDCPEAPAPAPRPPVVGIDGKTYRRPEPSDIDRAVAEFPDLAYYAETGRSSDALSMADDLRRFRDRGELDARLDTLRRSIAVDRAKRDGTYRPGTTAVMDDAGEYRMEPIPAPAPATTRTCPTCSGRGVIEEN